MPLGILNSQEIADTNTIADENDIGRVGMGRKVITGALVDSLEKRFAPELYTVPLMM